MELVTIYLSYIFLRWTVSHYLFDVRSHMKSRNYAVCHQELFPNIIHMSCFENKDLKKSTRIYHATGIANTGRVIISLGPHYNESQRSDSTV